MAVPLMGWGCTNLLGNWASRSPEGRVAGGHWWRVVVGLGKVRVEVALVEGAL